MHSEIALVLTIIRREMCLIFDEVLQKIIKLIEGQAALYNQKYRQRLDFKEIYVGGPGFAVLSSQIDDIFKVYIPSWRNQSQQTHHNRLEGPF